MQTICGATFVFDHDGEPDLIGNEHGRRVSRDGRPGTGGGGPTDARPSAH